MGDSQTTKERENNEEDLKPSEIKQEAYKTPHIDLLEKDRAKEEKGKWFWSSNNVIHGRTYT